MKEFFLLQIGSDWVQSAQSRFQSTINDIYAGSTKALLTEYKCIMPLKGIRYVVKATINAKSKSQPNISAELSDIDPAVISLLRFLHSVSSHKMIHF